MKKRKPLFTENEWSFKLLDKVWREIDSIARNEFGLTYDEPQLEIVSDEQMLSAYTTHGLPVCYDHWSFGKHHEEHVKNYKRGNPLAYELIINTKPPVAYIMESNSMSMQTLVLAHACCGHSAFFKHNYMFQEFANPDYILPLMKYAKRFIADCEDLYGADRVAELLDQAHSLQSLSIDKHERVNESAKRKQLQKEKRLQNQQQSYDLVFDSLLTKPKTNELEYDNLNEDNLLYFVEKNSVVLEPWEREIIRIVRKTGQYFYPQIRTKLMNEGYASFWHYTLMNYLVDNNYITPGCFLEAIHSHTQVLMQPAHNSPYYSGLNPYKLGFEIFSDIAKKAGTKKFEAVDWAMKGFNDSSFILQYLSIDVIKKLQLFCIEEKEDSSVYTVSHIQEKQSEDYIRKKLSENYSDVAYTPKLTIKQFSIKDRKVDVQYDEYKCRWLTEATAEVLENFEDLMGCTLVDARK